MKIDKLNSNQILSCLRYSYQNFSCIRLMKRESTVPAIRWPCLSLHNISAFLQAKQAHFTMSGSETPLFQAGYLNIITLGLLSNDLGFLSKNTSTHNQSKILVWLTWNLALKRWLRSAISSARIYSNSNRKLGCTILMNVPVRYCWVLVSKERI